MSLPAKSRRPPLLCYVTDRSRLRRERGMYGHLLEKIAQLSAAGVDWIQIREKDLSGRGSTGLVEKALRASSSANAPKIIVNDRLDVALSVGAAGVHLGEESLPLPAIRKLIKKGLLPEDFLIGVSCHSLEAARLAEQQGADYVFFGPIFATPEKISYGRPQGLAALEKVSQVLTIPVLAIGGISLENASSCVSVGASGLAAIRLFQEATDAAAVVQALRSAVLS